MFTQKLFAHAMTQTFGSKEQKQAQYRENIFGMIEFAYFHAVRHGNTSTWGELIKAVSAGAGIKKAVRDTLAGFVPPRREIPKDAAALKKFDKDVTEEAATVAKTALDAIEAAYADARAEATAKREAKKEAAEQAEAEVQAARDQAIRDALMATEILSGAALVSPAGHPVAIAPAEWELLAELLASLRATEVATTEPAPLAVAA